METKATATATKAPKVKKEKVAKVPGKRGRPVLKGSARQARLARFAEVKAAGGTVKRGRPAGSGKPKVPKVKKVKAAKAVETAVETPMMETAGE